MNTPWAALLCKFSDDDSEPFERAFSERLFTSAGSGSLNMVDYFADCSHGDAYVSGSQVFGWYTLDKKRSEYAGSGPNWQGRLDLVNWARQAAADAGDDLSGFYGVVVCMNVATDVFGGSGQLAVCDLNSMQPSILGQEMGHGYGLSHSRIDGSTDDYQDPWDTMSTANAYSASHSEFQSVGPGLNAWNMRGQGWLDEARVWRGGESFDSTLVLRPLHRRDLPGLLAAELPGGFLAEFRVQERWDAGIPRPAVLVHRFDENRSYLMPGVGGTSDLTEGDKFERGSQVIPWVGFTSLEVLDIDAGARTARLRVQHVPRQRQPHEFEGIFGQLIGGVGVDGGGIIVLPGGRVVPVPPWDPMIRILEQIALYRESANIGNAPLHESVQRLALQRIAAESTKQLSRLQVFESPPLKFGEVHQHGEHEHGGHEHGHAAE